MGHREEYYKDGKIVPEKTIDTRILSEEKDEKIQRLKEKANEKLKESDWLLIREMDNGIKPSVEQKAIRNAIRSVCDLAELEIEDINSLTELDQYNPHLNMEEL